MAKKYTSKLLRSIAYFWIGFPLIYIVYCTAAMDLHIAGLVKLVLSPWYWFVSATAVVAGTGILLLRWYGWYAFLLSNFTITYQTAVVLAHYSESPHKILLFCLTACFQSLVILIIGREIRVPYFFPKIRWWESDPRYKLSVQTRLIRADGSSIEGEIMDLSKGGVFVKTHSYFVPDEQITLEFSLFDQKLSCTGKVVWRTESTVTHPKGVGVKFDQVSKETASILKQSTRKLKKLAQVYSQMTRERNWQEYLERERGYQGKKGENDSSE